MSEESKGKKKYTFKVAFISVICTLLFIIILLLFVLFGLKNCGHRDGGSRTSSSGSPSIDINKANDKFKKIVKEQMTIDGFDDSLGDVKAVTYEDHYPNYFNLDIYVTGNNGLYTYHINNSSYPDDKSGYDNVISYLLLDNTPDIFDGDKSLAVLSISSDSIDTDITHNCIITQNDLGTVKYLVGAYYQNNEYHVYQNKKLTTSHPFSMEADQIIRSSDLLFSYYQSLMH